MAQGRWLTALSKTSYTVRPRAHGYSQHEPTKAANFMYGIALKATFVKNFD